MAIRACPACAHQLSFESRACEGCLRTVAFDPAGDRFCAYDPQALAWIGTGGPRADLRPCRNTALGACNWLRSADSADDRCLACRLNRTIPDLSVPGVLARWIRIEDAKRRMLQGLLRLGLPVERDGYTTPITFDFLYDPVAESGAPPQFITGHAGGVITLNVVEADDVARERIRTALKEPYRTLLGHFRHEIAHYYWHRLVEHTPDLGPFRTLFGDERGDYQAALQAYYDRGPQRDWQSRFISAYAATHPWEDFAETFAHYLHIVDTLATVAEAELAASDGPPIDPYTADFAAIGARWIPMAFKLNEISRSMGQRDLYPFSLSPVVMVKLDFVHRLIAFAAGRWAPGANEGAELKAMMSALGHNQSPAAHR
jgi:hypothetical protein